MRLSVLVFCVLLAVVVGAGCGSSGSSSGTVSSGGETSSEATTAGAETKGSESEDALPLSKGAFVKEAEAICRKIPTVYQERAGALAKSMKKGQKPTPAELKLKAAVPTDNLAIAELEALPPPAGDEQKVEAIIQSLENAVKGMEEDPKNPEFTGPKSPFAEWQKLTKAYGLSYCSTL